MLTPVSVAGGCCAMTELVAAMVIAHPIIASQQRLLDGTWQGASSVPRAPETMAIAECRLATAGLCNVSEPFISVAPMPDMARVAAPRDPQTRSLLTRLKWAMNTIVQSPVRRLQAARRISQNSSVEARRTVSR
jgi:hypothetical protein